MSRSARLSSTTSQRATARFAHTSSLAAMSIPSLRDFLRFKRGLKAEKPTRPISIRISDSLHSSCTAIAERDGITLHAWIIRTMEERAWGAMPTGMFVDSQFDGQSDAAMQRDAEYRT